LWRRSRGGITTFVLAHSVFQAKAHFQRLNAAVGAQEMTLPWVDESAWTEFLAQIALVTPEKPCVVRVCVAQDEAGLQTVWVSFRPVPAKTAPLQLTTCHYDRPLPAYKTLHDLAWADTLRDLKAAGFDEALRVNSAGYVAEAVYANLFGVDANGELVTPAESTGCLPGTMARAVRVRAQKLGMSCRDVSEPVAYFEALPGLFLTNAVRGLMPVGQLNQTHYAQGLIQPVIERLNLNL